MLPTSSYHPLYCIEQGHPILPNPLIDSKKIIFIALVALGMTYFVVNTMSIYKGIHLSRRTPFL